MELETFVPLNLQLWRTNSSAKFYELQGNQSHVGGDSPLAFPGDLLSSYILDSTHVMLSYELNCKNIISQVV
jgi:hypothetical protein